MPFALFFAGLATFAAIGVAGASVIERYLAVPALALMIFAAVALGGWTMLRSSHVRTGWMAGAALIVILGVAYTVTHLNLTQFDNELRFRGQAHQDLTTVLENPAVQAGLKCGPLTGPNHKIVPDSRWIAGLGDGQVLAREWVQRVEQQQADARAGKLDGKGHPVKYPPQHDLALAQSTQKGVAIVVTSRFAIFKHAWSDATDDPINQVPPAGFTRTATSRFYAAYVRC